MAKNFFKRYVWLITTIYRHKYITRADINRLWEHSQLNELHEKFSERTFHHHRDAIEEMFGIRILCDRSQGYYIANRDDWENDGIQEWLLESMAMNDLVNETSDCGTGPVARLAPHGDGGRNRQDAFVVS